MYNTSGLHDVFPSFLLAGFVNAFTPFVISLSLWAWILIPNNYETGYFACFKDGLDQWFEMVGQELIWLLTACQPKLDVC